MNVVFLGDGEGGDEVGGERGAGATTMGAGVETGTVVGALVAVAAALREGEAGGVTMTASLPRVEAANTGAAAAAARSLADPN